MHVGMWEEAASETWCSEYSQVDHRRREGGREGTLCELTTLLGARPGPGAVGRCGHRDIS